jgi:predicted dithiol-disulfide oxidoreductase (DUF899 family)
MGRVGLLELFDGERQLVVQHFIFHSVGRRLWPGGQGVGLCGGRPVVKAGGGFV